MSVLLEPLRQKYDYIIIDTNPSLGLLTINALAACDSVIIPVNPQLWSANGLAALLNIILKVQKKLNPSIRVSGILITMTDERTNLYKKAMGLIDEYFRNKIRIYDVQIPSTVKVGEANFHSCSVSDFDEKNKAALAYSDFAKEVMGYGNSESDCRETKTSAYNLDELFMLNEDDNSRPARPTLVSASTKTSSENKDTVFITLPFAVMDDYP
ncbi:ParA family protein [Desulfotomaculum sp. 1211_IL3151]